MEEGPDQSEYTNIYRPSIPSRKDNEQPVVATNELQSAKLLAQMKKQSRKLLRKQQKVIKKGNIEGNPTYFLPNIACNDDDPDFVWDNNLGKLWDRRKKLATNWNELTPSEREVYA